MSNQVLSAKNNLRPLKQHLCLTSTVLSDRLILCENACYIKNTFALIFLGK